MTALAHFPDMDATRNPIVQLTDTNEAMADSRDVAAYFEKAHRDVLRNIRELHCSAEFREREFAPFKIKDLSGETTSHVTMTKDGFTFLAMGFTGVKAALFKERYIKAFNVMEAELRRRAIPPAPVAQIPDFKNPAAAARAWAEQYEARDLAEAKVAELAPKAQFHDDVAESANCQDMEAVAKVLGIGRNTLFKFLREQSVIQPAPSTKPYQRFLDRGYFELVGQVWHRDGVPNTTTKTLVTGKGFIFIQRLLAEKDDGAPVEGNSPAPSAPQFQITH